MDDFQHLSMHVGPTKYDSVLSTRDHGHEWSIRNSYETGQNPDARGCSAKYVWECGQLFLKTKDALETSKPVIVECFSA
jgi:hypothetical protein